MTGPKGAFDRWMNSGPQYDNLLDPNCTKLGVGFACDANSGLGGYFVVVFARPASVCMFLR